MSEMGELVPRLLYGVCCAMSKYFLTNSSSLISVISKNISSSPSLNPNA